MGNVSTKQETMINDTGLWKYKTRNNDKWYWAYESTKQGTMINDTGLMKVQNKKQW